MSYNVFVFNAKTISLPFLFHLKHWVYKSRKNSNFSVYTHKVKLSASASLRRTAKNTVVIKILELREEWRTLVFRQLRWAGHVDRIGTNKKRVRRLQWRIILCDTYVKMLSGPFLR
jgi:hypothetical protein